MSLATKPLIKDVTSLEESLALVHRLQNGDQEAVNDLVALYADRMLRTATLILNDYHLAEDVVQEVLIDAITHIRQFRGDASLYSWIYTILVRRCRKQGKRRHRNLLDVKSNEKLTQLLDDTPDVLEQYILKAEHHSVRKAISKLSLAHREVITLFYYEELPLERISIIANITLGTVKSRLHRARLKLKKLLSKECG